MNAREQRERREQITRTTAAKRQTVNAKRRTVNAGHALCLDYARK